MEIIKAGLSLEIEELVTDDKSAKSLGSGLLDVYSTPSMIALMEKTSMLCVEHYIDENESTVGGAINIRHMRPTAIGKTVNCSSVVKEIVGKKVEFEVEVYEGKSMIGTGTHVRFIVDKKSFMSQL